MRALVVVARWTASTTGVNHAGVFAVAASPELDSAGGRLSASGERWSICLSDCDEASIHRRKGGNTNRAVVVKAHGWNAVIESTAEGVYVTSVVWLEVGLIVGVLWERVTGVDVARHSER